MDASIKPQGQGLRNNEKAADGRRGDPSLSPRKRIKNSARKTFFRKASVVLYCLAIFLLPIFFIPSAGFSLATAKVAMVSFLVLASGVSFFFSRAGERIKIPAVFFSILGGVGSLLILSTIFSESFKTSFLGVSFETGTFYVLFLGLIVAALGSLIISSLARFFAFFISFISGAVMLGVFHLLRFVFGSEKISLSVFSAADSTPVGTWFDLGIFMGVVFIVSLAVLIFGVLPRKIKAVFGVALALSVVFLFMVFNSVVLSSLLVVTVGMVALALIKKKEVPVVAYVSTALLVLLLTFGAGLNERVTTGLGIDHIAVRPTVDDTLRIVGDDLGNIKNALIGRGPNTFSYMWQQGRSEEVLMSGLWSADFSFGSGILPTFFATLGVLAALGFVSLVIYQVYQVWLSWRQESADSFGGMIFAASAFASLFLMILAAVYTYGAALWILAFALLGVSVSAMASRPRSLMFWELNTRSEKGAAVFGIFMLLCVVGIAHMGAVVVARGLYGQALVAAANIREVEDIQKIHNKLSLASLLERNDTYERTRTDLALVEIQQLMTLEEEYISEAIKERFGNAVRLARDTSSKAISIDPRNYLNWVSHGFVLETIAFFQMNETFEEAARMYALARVENPTNPELALMQARLELARGNFDEAKGFVEEAIAMKPNYSSAYVLLANIGVAESDSVSSVRAMERAIENIPNMPQLYYQLGTLHYSQENYRKAIEVFNEAIKLDSVYANARYYRGLSAYRTGDSDAALKDLEYVLTSNSDNSHLRSVIDNIKNGRDPFDGIESSDSVTPLGDAESSEEESEELVIEGDDSTESSGVNVSEENQ